MTGNDGATCGLGLPDGSPSAPTRLVCAAVAVAALMPGLVPATEPLPLGPPFRVNTGISGRDPQVAVDPAGNVMIVWDAFDEADEIRGRRFFATGIPAGNERPLASGGVVR